MIVSHISSLHVDPTEHNEHNERIQGGESTGNEGWGIREGVHPPRQWRAAEPERTPPPQHPDRCHPGGWQCSPASTLRCACGLQVSAKNQASTQMSPLLPTFVTYSSCLLSVDSSTRCIPTACCFGSAVATLVGSSSPWLSPSLTPWIPPASLCCWTSCTPPAFPWP